jgi:lipoprotein-anchoring transpeptidase ErfK/SrfK
MKGVWALRTTARVLSALVAIGGAALLTGCSAAAANWQAAGTAPGQQAPSISAPADGATGVPAAAEVVLAGADPKTTVTLTDASGTAVAGALRADRSSWVPAEPLKWGTTYTATVGTTGKKISFTTMKRPGNTVRASTPLVDDAVYGVAMPLIVRFGTDIPKDRRAAVEKRLFVTSEPAQPGVWSWFSGTEVHYRTRDYWQTGTRFAVRVATGGLPLGDGTYGADDLTIRASIGNKVEMVTDNATKTMTVKVDDQVARTIPVSLGKPGKPSSSGHLVVMTKNYAELFVGNDPGDSYRTTVYWTQRLTIGGEYIHAAPWSVGDQGRRNVSHGCTNMSTENAKWLFGITHVGDPVVVTGTEAKLQWGNGWTDWDRSFDEYAQGSALGAPTVAAAGTAATAGPTQTP